MSNSEILEGSIRILFLLIINPIIHRVISSPIDRESKLELAIS
jgi:hypothetical protein